MRLNSIISPLCSVVEHGVYKKRKRTMKVPFIALLLLAGNPSEERPMPACIVLPTGVELCMENENPPKPRIVAKQCKNWNGVKTCLV